MKVSRILMLLLVLIILTDCRQKKDDEASIKKVLTEYFHGIKVQDLAKLNSLTTNDFVLFENGKIWNNDSLVSIKHKYKSFTGEWRFDFMRIDVNDSSAEAVYFNHGELIFNDTLQIKLDWLESATFRKVENQWKLSFLHSTVRK